MTLYARNNEIDKAHAKIDQAHCQLSKRCCTALFESQCISLSRRTLQSQQAELNKAIELDPNYLAAYSALAGIYIDAKQEDRAIAEYQKIIERRPDNSVAYTLIGILEDQKKELRRRRRELPQGTGKGSERGDRR